MQEFSSNPKVYIWDGKGANIFSLHFQCRFHNSEDHYHVLESPCSGPNPHLGHLAWADAFVITADSVSMLSEACSTGYVWT